MKKQQCGIADSQQDCPGAPTAAHLYHLLTTYITLTTGKEKSKLVAKGYNGKSVKKCEKKKKSKLVGQALNKKSGLNLVPAYFSNSHLQSCDQR